LNWVNSASANATLLRERSFSSRVDVDAEGKMKFIQKIPKQAIRDCARNEVLVI